jgi:hypothetical protein
MNARLLNSMIDLPGGFISMVLITRPSFEVLVDLVRHWIHELTRKKRHDHRSVFNS